MARRGLFVAFEGADGVGKTSLIRAILKHAGDSMQPDETLGMEHLPVPSRTAPAGTALRSILHADKQLPAEVELGMFATAILEASIEAKRMLYIEKKTVFADRWWPSSAIYQGFARGVPLETVRSMTQGFQSLTKAPDLYVIVDAPDAIIQRNLLLRGGPADALEEDMGVQTAVRAAYRRPSIWLPPGAPVLRVVNDASLDVLVPALLGLFSHFATYRELVRDILVGSALEAEVSAALAAKSEKSDGPEHAAQPDEP